MSEVAIRRPEARKVGFFTDTTTCIGCKACEVACKQWNDLPADGGEFRKGGSYDHTGSLGASTWRHVRFVEALAPAEPLAGGDLVEALAPTAPAHDGDLDLVAWASDGGGADRWIFMSDVCKHCAHAGCLDACPTGALIRTEFDTVVLQPDVCNGCGYCVPACPFGVVALGETDGKAHKCTLCYDRLQDGLEPACAKACPTDSIQFGPYEELVDTAQRRVGELHERGLDSAYLYGTSTDLAGGLGAFFLLTEAPERYGLPATAESPVQEGAVTTTLASWGAGLAAAALVSAAFRVAAHSGARDWPRLSRGRARW